jgi:hypothetical protein
MDRMTLSDRSPGTWLLAAVLVVGVALGCTNDPGPTAPVDDTPPAPTSTETFTGSFGQNGSSVHTFTVVATGDITIEIKKLEPVPTLTVGVSLGNYDDSNDPPCSVFASDNRVVVGSELFSGSAVPGEYCVSIRDVGNVFPDATVTYTVKVTHP